MAKVVVVDDSPFLVKTLRTFLEEDGHEILATGGDGQEGIDLYQKHRPELMFLDITMPNKDGRDCLIEVLAKDEDARIVMISAIKDMSVIMECLRHGAKGYVEKPLKLGDPKFRASFRATIAEALEK